MTENLKLLIKELKENFEFQRKFLLGIGGMIFGIIITYYLYPLQPYRLGLVDSPSIFKKVVVYELKKPEKIEKNRLYVFPLPFDTKYYKKGTLFIKYAKCLPGERLEVKGMDYYCDGVFFAKAKPTDVKGVPVKHFEYNGTIPDGYVFMYAPHPRSYDSRYWGLLPISAITGEGIISFWDYR